MGVEFILSTQFSYWFPEQPFIGISKSRLDLGWAAGELMVDKRMLFPLDFLKLQLFSWSLKNCHYIQKPPLHLFSYMLLINSFLFKFILKETLYYFHKQKSSVMCHKWKVTVKKNDVIMWPIEGAELEASSWC